MQPEGNDVRMFTTMIKKSIKIANVRAQCFINVFYPFSKPVLWAGM